MCNPELLLFPHLILLQLSPSQGVAAPRIRTDWIRPETPGPLPQQSSLPWLTFRKVSKI